ncbi:hypothetical protein BO70DRAFT_374791 [Aspergillus heteromorphus CBS 117.55]|uniref:Zn(2)-C6 fungal-type domain-containing protein n=1 Tax=Aspergillus heteromorphus CBS 117.55 TaxID=1448321 RepID=A0A317UXM2_9EURO|nr:uncharacterized protein BO70DRAFT_374791 [Aspergillus heteromorphus CBS 117.55]PWY66089.1 hypothetical protein BO70DRAFT_374791 [Aspergillus heteromorphus CBS 117.55]
MEPLSKARVRKTPSASAPGTRKRRKRTVVSQAADDCFTCARQGTPCDRRRPYCSQCLEGGRDCAGYKTTLTWGVGVASRGKLRGLSLPVTGAAQPAASPSRPRHAAGSPRVSQPRQPVESTAENYCIPRERQPSLATGSSDNGAPFMATPGPQARPAVPAPCARELYTTHSTMNPTACEPLLPGSRRADLMPQYHMPPIVSNTLDVEIGMRPVPSAQWPWPGHSWEQETENGSEEQIEQMYSDDTRSWLGAFQSPSLSQQLLARSVGRTPRLQYLISYYAEVIAPMIVAFDSPTNPFRTYVLRLAQESVSLQEAIATLATCNLRQRREGGTRSTERTLPARLSSLAHQVLTDDTLQDRSGNPVPEASAQEEQFHRGMAVKELNRELADSRQRLSDSVLATLLILCLFHCCDTGVAQFKTQFAGVTKLLAIRLCNSRCMSDELKWFVRMFTWIDTMTATTNDREVQLRGACLDITAVSDSEWGLENLAGCDAGLFRMVAQLGRLNLLSQNQEVRTLTPPDIYIPSTTVPPSMAFYSSNGNPLPPPPSDRDRTALPPKFWTEWYSLRQKLESWRFLPQRQMSTPDSTPNNSYISPPSSPPIQSVVAPQHVQDVIQISESFRHAAILYSERLAYPELPSAHPRIQYLVQRTMSHILAVQCDAYLLWPLFIAGSECVLAGHRDLVRKRCKDLSRDSGFFNNLSCLGLLEKVWAKSPMGSGSGEGYPTASIDLSAMHGAGGRELGGWTLPGASSMGPAPSPRKPGLRWHEAMQSKRAEGEYMTV